MTAEAEGVGDGGPDIVMDGVVSDQIPVGIDGWVGFVKVHGWRRDAVLDSHDGGDATDRASALY